MSTWVGENGFTGACSVCGRKTWIEFGCAELCDSCEPGDENPPDNERDTLASLGMREADFR